MKRDYTGLLLEDMNHKFDIMLEAIQPIPKMAEDIAILKDDVFELKNDMKAVKAVLTDQGKHLRRHDGEIATLQKAVFKTKH